MRLLVLEPQISADKQTLSFVIGRRGESITCVMPRRRMQVSFWLPHDADDARLVSVFRNEFSGIEAVARRQLLARSTRRSA
jgi:hypothetical protein